MFVRLVAATLLDVATIGLDRAIEEPQPPAEETAREAIDVLGKAEVHDAASTARGASAPWGSARFISVWQFHKHAVHEASSRRASA